MNAECAGKPVKSLEEFMMRRYMNPRLPYLTLPSPQCKIVVLPPMTHSCSQAAGDSNQNTECWGCNYSACNNIHKQATHDTLRHMY